MNKAISTIIVIIALAVFAGLIYYSLNNGPENGIERQANNQEQSQDIETPNQTAENDLPSTNDENQPPVSTHPDIKVTSISTNQLITSPHNLRGEARGTWFFEASFPVRLEDANGNVLVQIPAQAQGEWMTENFVPYQATLRFNQPSTATGVLILEKDNPSGLPENAAEIRIPVRFK